MQNHHGLDRQFNSPMRQQVVVLPLPPLRSRQLHQNNQQRQGGDVILGQAYQDNFSECKFEEINIER